MSTERHSSGCDRGSHFSESNIGELQNRAPISIGARCFYPLFSTLFYPPLFLLEKTHPICYTPNAMKIQKFETVVWKEGKYFVAQCLNVDVSSFGKTKKSALKNVEEALALYFEDTKQERIQKIEQPVIVRHQLQHA